VQPVARELKFCGPLKGLETSKQALGFVKGIANLSWIASMLTQAAMARGPIWLCAFIPALVHD